MLILNRKDSEGITLNTSDGEVYIGFSTSSPVKVAIEAPQAVIVFRDELVDTYEIGIR